jgi:hypothetical protein
MLDADNSHPSAYASHRCARFLVMRSAALGPQQLLCSYCIPESGQQGHLAQPEGTCSVLKPWHGAVDHAVYFDNPQLDVYHTRLARLDGARLTRIRYAQDATAISGFGVEGLTL